jgi:O-antigen/teichoic acid export membrane protein
MRVQSKSVLFTVSNLVKLSFVLGLTVYFIVVKHTGIIGIYYAQVAGNLLFIVLLSGYVLKNCVIFFSRSIITSMSGYGFPLLLANFAAASLTVVDRYSLNSMALLKYVAIYSLAYKISSVLKLVIVDSVKMALTPMAMQKMNSPDNKRFYSKSMLYTSFVLMLGIMVISLFSFEIIKLISGNRQYWEAFFVVPLLSLSVFFVNMRETTIYALIITKETRIIGINVVIASILNIILNILLIPLLNITGAAIATVLSQFFYWILNYYFSQKKYFIPYELKKVAILFFWGSLISFSGLLLTDMHLLPRLIIKTVCLLSFPFLLYISNFYEQVELQAIKGFVVKWSKIRNLKENLKSLRNITTEF